MFLFWLYFIGFHTTKMSYLIVLGFNVEQTMLPELVGNVIQLPLIGRFLRWIAVVGPWRMSTLAHGLLAVSYLLWGPCSLIYPRLGPYLGSVFQSIGTMMVFPACRTIISQRVGEEH